MINKLTVSIKRKTPHKQSIFSALAFSGMLVASVYSTEAAEDGIHNTDLFRQTGIIRLTVEETIPENSQKKLEAINLLKSIQLTSVKTDVEPSVKKEVGYSFPTSAPWCLLTTKYIKSLNFRPNLGDWGCGHGFFSRHALISGANPYAIDSSLQAANEANKIIFQTKGYIDIPEGLKMTDLYKAANVSVVNPGNKFMERKNHINVAFNVLHYLSPSDADIFLQNLYTNTTDNGVVIICFDTPFDPNKTSMDYYNEGKQNNLKYPGYGVYSKSTIVFLDNTNAKNYLTRGAYRPTEEEEKKEKFKMGQLYSGIYPKITEFENADNGQTLKIGQGDPVDHPLNILNQSQRPYCYATGHQAFNKFDYNGLRNVVELAGFSVINGWYTDHSIDTLYPHDNVDLDKIRKSKVVIVAQKTT